MNILVFLMVVFVVLLILVVLGMPMVKLGFSFFEWDFLSFKFNLFFNSLLFSLILMVITLSVMLFSAYYLNGELVFSYYSMVLLVFVGSMFLLNFSNGVFSMMVSWDLLGISSFFLVLFYNNWDSNSGAMNTALTNRLGDFFMFCFFSSSMFCGLYFFSYGFLVSGLVLLLLLTSFTKSAQFPFSSWLPKAMSAPTPISSLVHSSTLVTAGLILLMNFDMLILNMYVMVTMMLVGLFTMFFSSFVAMFEEDMKKVVALSTLSQMGFMMLTLGLGLHFVSFLHLVSHALFKSCLFMQIGYLIHSNFGQQDGRSYGNNGSLPIFMQLQLLTTLFCLCGLVFTSGMVSKDLILELFFFNSGYVFLILLFVVSVFLTFGYSYRLWKNFFLSFPKSLMVGGGSFLMNYLSLFLVFFSIVFLNWVGVNLLNVPSFFLFVDFYLPLVYVGLLVLFSYMVLKFLLKELVYKFFVDYYSSYFAKMGLNVKFVDSSLNSVGYKLYGSLSLFSKNFGMIMSSFSYNSLVILIFFVFFLL